MYNALAFRETRTEVMHALMRAHPLATLVVLTAKDLSREEREQLNGHVSEVLDKANYSQLDLVRDIRLLMHRATPTQP